MQIKIRSNIDGLQRLLQQTPDAVGDGVKTAMHDIKSDWQSEALEVAPVDSGKLRQQIQAKVDGGGIERGVTIESNTYNKGFNYAYYIHEGHMAADGKQLRTTGTVEDYLNHSADKRVAVWLEWLEEDVKRELRRKGW